MQIANEKSICIYNRNILDYIFEISLFTICKTQLFFLNLQICICKYVFPVIPLFSWAIKHCFMEISDRLKLYIDHTGLTSSQFADLAGIPRPTLSQLLNGRNKKVSNELTGKLHASFPDLNILWLLFGEGDMGPVANMQFSEPKNAHDGNLFDENVSDYKQYTPDNSLEISSPKQQASGFNDCTQADYDVKASESPKVSAVPYVGSPSSPSPSSAPAGLPSAGVGTHQGPNYANTPDVSSRPAQPVMNSFSHVGSNGKRIAYIMVFYTDNSFETFNPADSV